MPRRALEWNSRAGRYRDPLTGRFISRDTVRSILDQAIAKSQQRIQATSDALRGGTLSLDDWHVVMREEIKRTQIAAEMLVQGGRAQMTAADYGRVGQRVRIQYDYLRDFAHGLADGAIRTDGSFLNRAKMYANAARVAFHESLADQLAGLGYTHERNVLHPAEHCAGCLAETERGEVPIFSLVPIGDRPCGGSDKCSIAYSVHR
jgi:hypothetical protein